MAVLERFFKYFKRAIKRNKRNYKKSKPKVKDNNRILPVTRKASFQLCV